MALSCQRRGFCPSCSAKRGAIFGALLAEDILEEVSHSLWTFTLPKMLRPYFLFHRELLGRLCQIGWEVVRELMIAATGEPDLKPGMVAVVHTHGDQLGFHPHVHALASLGGWDAAGEWVPVPFVDTGAAERLFRHRVIALLRDLGLLSEERIELMMSWRHSGFSVHNAVRVAPGDTAGIERLGRYLLRSPVSLERLELEPDTGKVFYQHKDARGRTSLGESYDGGEFLARLLQHIPEPRLHQVRYYGRYSSVARARRAATEAEASVSSPSNDPGGHGDAADVEPDAAERRRLRRHWASLIRRVYEVDPLVCCECGGEMRILAFVLDYAQTAKILAHLGQQQGQHPSRAPPVQPVQPLRAAVS